MKTIVYDRVSKMVKDCDRPPMPFELSMDIPYPFVLTKTVEEPTGNMIQKVNTDGEPLYKIQTGLTEMGGEIYEETAEARTITAWETRLHTYRIATDEMVIAQGVDEMGEPIDIEVPVYEPMTATVEVPVEWTDHDPIMIPEVISKTYTFEQNCYLFTTDEVAEAIANTVPVPTEIELLKEQLLISQGAIDFIIMNS